MEQTISPEKDGKRNDPILRVLFEKETADFINGKRMLLFTILIGLITITGFYAALSGLHAETASGESSAAFLLDRKSVV